MRRVRVAAVGACKMVWAVCVRVCERERVCVCACVHRVESVRVDCV